jgi:alanine racemase
MNLSEIRIDVHALRENICRLKALAGEGTKICVVVKGNAYGHGLSEVVGALAGGVDYFQVDDYRELAAIRAITNEPVLVLGYMNAWETERALRIGCEASLFDVEHVRILGALARQFGEPVRVHLKLDALLGRLGILPTDLDSMLDEIERWPQLELAAIYAHYANIEDTTDLAHADAQRELLFAAEQRLSARSKSLTSHISATSGLMTLEASQPRHLVRIGIGAYGMYPSGPLARTHGELGLRPVLSWVSHLAQVKTLPPKHPVGYGLTYVTAKSQKIGIVPQGYSDGFDRGLSNSGEVLVRGVRCPVIGRIAMNMFAVDLTGAPEARRDDEVVLIGRQGELEIAAEDLAAKLGTINYEITSRISPLLPRVTF